MCVAVPCNRGFPYLCLTEKVISADSSGLGADVLGVAGGGWLGWLVIEIMKGCGFLGYGNLPVSTLTLNPRHRWWLIDRLIIRTAWNPR